MPGIVLVPLDEAGLSTLEAWFRDAELRRRMGGSLPLGRWFAFMRSEPGYLAWMAQEEHFPVGMVSLETSPDETASVGLIVKPELRNRGYGKRILREVLSRAEVAPLRALEVGVEADNSAGLRCAAAVGFSGWTSEPDADGFLTFVYAVPGQ
jgi:RimJ/RimL family protein N-acetyltransferase